MQYSEEQTEQFNQNWRRKQELQSQPFADEIYMNIIPMRGRKRIERLQDANHPKHILDREFGVDVIFTNNDRMQISCQEKFLSYEEAHFNSITIEYYQDYAANPPVKGDFFKLCVDYYFVGYLNEDKTGFCKWAVIDFARLKTETMIGNIYWQENRNTKDGARASFKWTDLKNLPLGCVLVQRGFGLEDHKYPNEQKYQDILVPLED